jgi:1,4-alpha-glucan branching enzyme
MFVEKLISSKTAQIMFEVDSCLQIEKKTPSPSSEDLQASKTKLERIRLNFFQRLVLKIVAAVLNFFNVHAKCIASLQNANILAEKLIHNYTDLLKDPNAQIDDSGFIYDVSLERVKNSLKQNPEKRLNITMVGAEYAGIKKHGGLAEAIEGLSQALFQNGHNVNLIFPKYSKLPPEIEKKLTKPIPHIDSSGNPYQVYEAKVGGINCCFIEHPSFELDAKEPSIYGSNFDKIANRFSNFSSLAADLIQKSKDIDIVHLHDWHVAGVGLKLKKKPAESWAQNKAPAIVFTFHNNQKPAQGRLYSDAYSYSPIIHGYVKHKIINHNENLFTSTLLQADAITTVSETFAKESQEVSKGAGISCSVRQAARIGKITGILNGANLKRWNPASDKMLSRWKDIESKAPLPLNYEANDEDLLERKAQIRGQLQKWIDKFIPNVKFDAQKPIITYIGRFDSKQKGIDKLEMAIKATLENGGQFICMGLGEDEQAMHILDRLQSKYKDGVLFLRDKITGSGTLFYQDGDETRPGISSLVRASTTFTFIPSNFEPCGLVQFEGWQFGSLAIGAKTGGLEDSIRHKENGFLFENNPTSVIREALQYWECLSDDQKLQKIQEVMIDVEKQGWTQAARKYEVVYQAALQKRDLKPLSTLESLKYRTLASIDNIESQEESYLAQFYLHDRDSASLRAFHKTLSEEAKLNVPSPYGKKVDFSLYKKFGSFPDGKFAVSAPNAKQVELVLLNDHDEHLLSIPMYKEDGVWKTTVSNLQNGQKYQYKIDGRIKLDPYAKLNTPVTQAKQIPSSVVVQSKYVWNDGNWLKNRNASAANSNPISIYEVHLESWKQKNGKPLNYRELANEIVQYCKQTGYTHVELMGILDHPDVRSWGYQVTGFFAPNSRMGSVDDFKYFIDTLHQNEIGVILDFVPAHFASDSFGLDKFDGTHQYDASGLAHYFSVRNWAFNYGAKHFDFSQKQVREFLTSSAMYWIKEMHIDGLRVDCVRSLLSSEDPDSAELFLADLNAIIHNHGKGAISIAEDFSGDPKITQSPLASGLDFDRKWHISFGKLFLKYLHIAPSERKNAYTAIQDAIQSDNFHRQVLSLNHDQANEFTEILQNIKDPVQKQNQLKAVLSFLMCLPGKKLNFMTTDTLSASQWTDFVGHRAAGWKDIHSDNPVIVQMMYQLNALYKKEKAFHEFDDNGYDLEWIDDKNKHIHAYRRKGSDGKSFICMHNFTDEAAVVPISGVKEIFNSAADDCKGKDIIPENQKIEIAPLSTIILEEIA